MCAIISVSCRVAYRAVRIATFLLKAVSLPRAVSRPKLAFRQKAASRPRVASRPKVVSHLKVASRPKVVSHLKVVSRLKVVLLPKVASIQNSADPPGLVCPTVLADSSIPAVGPSGQVGWVVEVHPRVRARPLVPVGHLEQAAAVAP
jgi:hypothetical protein